DRFLNHKLADAGVTPAPRAERRTLIRRAYLDLLGLPPTWEEMQTAMDDDAPDWWQRLVDRLLADERHGPRWARHWLDVARYADTRGYRVAQQNINFPFAWTYRDWVVDAINADLPYDEFVTLQLAADRLGLPQNDPHLAATGFLSVGDRFNENVILIADDQVDLVSRGLLGMTVACARCHDHKFDPVPTEDYYALYGVFRSSQTPETLPRIGEPPDTPEVRAFLAKKKELEAAVAAEEAKQRKVIDADLRKRFGQYLAAGAGLLSKDDERLKALRTPAVRHFQRLLTRAKPDHPALNRWRALKKNPDSADAKEIEALIDRFDAADGGQEKAASNRFAVTPP
ncbi:MAG: DUF1549 domain-containing protein, partial [Planctomycetota bacterium]